MDRMTSIKIKYNDGTYSNQIPVYPLAGHVEWDTLHNLVDILGNVDLNKGNVQEQLNILFNDKVTYAQMISYVSTHIIDFVGEWLENNIESAAGHGIANNTINVYTYPTNIPLMPEKTISGALNTLLGNFAPPYDNTIMYSKGDFCTYNGQLYECKRDILVAEDFNIAKWEASTVFQCVSNGKELIADAITDKGVPTSASDTFEEMADNISRISSGGGSGFLRPHLSDVATSFTIPEIIIPGTYTDAVYTRAGTTSRYTNYLLFTNCQTIKHWAAQNTSYEIFECTPNGTKTLLLCNIEAQSGTMYYYAAIPCRWKEYDSLQDAINDFNNETYPLEGVSEENNYGGGWTYFAGFSGYGNGFDASLSYYASTDINIYYSYSSGPYRSYSENPHPQMKLIIS